MTTLDVLSRAERMLAQCATAEDAVEIINYAEAARVLAKQMDLGASAVNYATTIKLKAERRLAEVVDEGQQRGEIATAGGNTTIPRTPGNGPAKLDDIGVDSRRLAEARTIRDTVSDEEVEALATEATEEGRELSRNAVLGRAHVANNSGQHEWYTPAEYINAARAVMGAIDLDPASSEAANVVVNAARFYDESDDGLTQAWKGRVWMNPPYASKLVGPFAEKLTTEFDARNVTEACVLVNNATETEAFQRLLTSASAVCFPKRRIRFWYPDRPSFSPLQGQAIVYLGEHVSKFLREFCAFGATSRWGVQR